MRPTVQGERRARSGVHAERREQLIALAEAVAQLAENRGIKAVGVHEVRDDLEIRPVLDTVIRRWTRLVPTTYTSAAAMRARRAKLHREHIVPCRVLVDRMIMNPAECRALLETAVVIASVTEAEHRRLGGIYKDTPDLYRRMLKGSVARLPKRGMERYTVTGIALQPT
jgi:hypothetical protein